MVVTMLPTWSVPITENIEDIPCPNTLFTYFWKTLLLTSTYFDTNMTANGFECNSIIQSLSGYHKPRVILSQLTCETAIPDFHECNFHCNKDNEPTREANQLKVVAYPKQCRSASS